MQVQELTLLGNRFEGRTAVITGAGHGTGKQAAGDLEAEGAIVILTDIDGEALDSAVTETSTRGGRGESIICKR